jgi:hypothetical protein
MKCIVDRGMKINMFDYWKHFVQHRSPELVRIAHWYSHNNKPDWRTAMYKLRSRECNTFNPMILANIIKLYFSGEPPAMLDMSMGWGDRLLGALASGVKTYVGFDPNTDLHKHYGAMRDDLADYHSTNTTFIPDKFSKDKIPAHVMGKFDLAMTSPPFYSFEVYEGSEKDINTPYSNWLKTMYIPYITDACCAVAVGGYVCIYIDNIPTMGNMADDTKTIMDDNDMKYITMLTYQTNNTDMNGHVTNGTHRSCWVWQKC